MSLPIVFRPEARAEYDEAADWYEARSAGLGAAFTAAVERVLNRIAAQPKFYATVWKDVREGLVSKYPYVVYYLEEPTRIVVLSVFHASRNPQIWKRRLGRP